MKPECCSTEVAFFGNCDKITEMTKFQAAVQGVPALRILCGHDLLAALEPLKFAISVRIHWRCAMLQAGIRQISGRADMDADSRAVGTITRGPLAVFVPSCINIRRQNRRLCSKRTSKSLQELFGDSISGASDESQADAQ